MANSKTPAQVVAAARSQAKITTPELIEHLFDDFFELHGDRQGSDDPAIVGGLARFCGRPVTVVATDKGKTPKQRVAKHFGSPEPAGYRKLLRLAKQAEKFGRPVVTFVNTAGAYPGRSAEEQGQGEALARCLLELGQLEVPLITFIFGEGGSGGALAMACGDRVYMLEDSMYSVLSPEGFASILWKDSQRADEAAEVMQLTPEALLEHGAIEGVIAEDENDHLATVAAIKAVLKRDLELLVKKDPTELLAERYERFRKF
ncbi:acetyl-CoA carboxylase carboxyltransferase subunit alpha [Ligilactobacillus animalis]|uniref:acetyl-CoA carboxytransferase n=1 Tax=Ligilactobacillus animalis TaxID=1605 RepID=A0AAJ6FVZ1_9LACO|nr:carboxyltransferase subunit alpha [Ligilactobacillus animalis]MDO5883838.1 carboxyltransferase subunit alpha [Ligilactobacillus animalis]MDQ2234036.1 acetyl-CoA carboxylase carboxyl transferase subunit alpha [Ligilactobacillus animalis]MDU1486906.1 carboxyltransferase subunit alpha [Ligilactobacillus animalis]MDU3186609.1 carboxyltransferase subunit alpha [Ligilactobacillus animalis]MDU8987209.1 carboxyltransferase subunit alpha [Ligilactobacillus animalis]